MTKKSKKSKSVVPIHAKGSPGAHLKGLRDENLASYFKMMKIKNQKKKLFSKENQELKKKQTVPNSPCLLENITGQREYASYRNLQFENFKNRKKSPMNASSKILFQESKLSKTERNNNKRRKKSPFSSRKSTLDA